MSDKSRTTMRLLVLLLIMVAGTLWTANRAYQSHYAVALKVISDAEGSEMASEAKDGRADEWATYIPKLKQAVSDNFADQSQLAPYFERNEWFINLPSRDISLVFVPNQLAFFALPPSYALSLQNFWYGALLLISTYWLCRNLSVCRSISVYLGVAVLLSQFVQVWWTSNFPVLGALLLPFAVFTSDLRDRWKFPLLFWSLAHLLFSQIYPPFYVAAVYGVLPLAFAAKPELINWRYLAGATLCAMAAGLLYYSVEHEFVDAVRATSYPGMRIAVGGDASLSTLAGLLIPTLPLENGFGGYNSVNEQSVVWSILPLLLICNASRISLDPFSKRILSVMLLMLVVLGVYAIVGWSRLLSLTTGLFMVPGGRTYLAFSLIANIGSAIVLSRHLRQISLGYSAVFLMAVAFAAYLLPQRSDLQPIFPGLVSLVFLPAIALAIMYAGSLLYGSLRGPDAEGPVQTRFHPVCLAILLIVTAFGHIRNFGSYNPIIDAREIFREEDTQLLRDWDALYAYNDEQPFGTIGNVGHVLRGYGRASLSAIELGNVPLSRFKQIYPYLTEKEIDTYFNRFVGIEFDNVAAPEMRGASVMLPIERHAPRFRHRIVDELTSRNLVVPPVGRVQPGGNGHFDVRWESWLDRGGELDKVIELSVPCPVAGSFVTRYPIGRNLDDPALDVELRGLAARLTLAVATEEEALDCVSQVKVGFALTDPSETSSDNLSNK